MSYKVAFIQESTGTQHGIMMLSAMLKEDKVSTDVFSLDLERGAFVDKVIKYNPDMVGLTMTTPGYRSMVKAINEIKGKNPKIFVVVG